MKFFDLDGAAETLVNLNLDCDDISNNTNNLLQNIDITEHLIFRMADDPFAWQSAYTMLNDVKSTTANRYYLDHVNNVHDLTVEYLEYVLDKLTKDLKEQNIEAFKMS